MKLKGHHKITPETHQPLIKPDHNEGYDPIFEWDNLCKNVKNFWHDLYDDNSE